MSVTLQVAPRFPAGTSVGAYLLPPFPFTGAPPGAAVATSTVAADGSLVFSVADGRYVAYAQVGGVDRYVRFRAGDPNQAAVKQGIYVPAGFGQNWRAKLAASGGALARAAVVGDSVSVGYYASNLQTRSWWAIVRDALQASHGDGGSGIRSVADTDLVLGNDGRSTGVRTAWAAAGNLVALSGTWVEVTNGTDGPGFDVIKASTVGATATFTVRGSTVEVFYQTTPSSTGAGSFTVQVDGGAPSGAISSFRATQGNVSSYVVSGLSAGTHTVVVTATDSNGTLSFSLCGVSGRNASGVVVDRYARGGQSSGAAANRSGGSFTWKNASGATWGGSAQNLRGGSGAWAGGSLRPADLIIYALGLNDAGGANTSPDAYVLNVRDYLEDVRNGGSQAGDADIVLLMLHAGKIENTSWYFSEYVTRLRGLAEAYGAALVNMWSLGRNSWNYWNALGYWGNSASVGVSGTDVAHLSDAGHKAVADAVLPVVSLG